MKNLLFITFVLLVSSSYAQTFYGVKLNKAYTMDELSSHFWDKSPVIDGTSFKFTMDGGQIVLQRDHNGVVYRIYSSHLPADKALVLFNNALSFFGTPNNGFKESKGVEKRYFVYFDDVVKTGDRVDLEYSVNSYYTGGELSTYVSISYSDFLYKNNMASPYSEGGLFEGWTLIKKY